MLVNNCGTIRVGFVNAAPLPTGVVSIYWGTAGSALGEEAVDGDDVEILRDGDVQADRGAPDSPATVDAGEDDGEQPGGTQVNPSSARVEALPMSPSGVGRGQGGCGGDGVEGGGLVGDMETSSRPIAGENDSGGEDDVLTDEDEVRNTQDAGEEDREHHSEHEEEEEDMKLTGGDVEVAQTTQMVDEMAGTVGCDERRGAAAERDSFRGGGGNNPNDDSSSTCTERSSTMRPPVTATLEEPMAESVAKTVVEPGAGITVEPEDGGEEVHQRLEEEAGDEEDSEEDGEGEFTVPSLNFSRGEKVSETRGSGRLGDGGSNGDCVEDAQADSGSFRDGARSPLFETLAENGRKAGRVL